MEAYACKAPAVGTWRRRRGQEETLGAEVGHGVEEKQQLLHLLPLILLPTPPLLSPVLLLPLSTRRLGFGE